MLCKSRKAPNSNCFKVNTGLDVTCFVDIIYLLQALGLGSLRTYNIVMFVICELAMQDSNIHVSHNSHLFAWSIWEFDYLSNCRLRNVHCNKFKVSVNLISIWLHKSFVNLSMFWCITVMFSIHLLVEHRIFGHLCDGKLSWNAHNGMVPNCCSLVLWNFYVGEIKLVVWPQ